MSSINLARLDTAGPALHDRYSNPDSLSWRDVSNDLYSFYDPSRLPENDIERQIILVNWLADESAEAAQADLGFNTNDSLADVGHLSYLSGAVTVSSLAPVANGSDHDTFLRPGGIEYAAEELGITRDVLVKRLHMRAFKILHELGDLNWFINAQTVQHSIDPLEAVKACELAPSTVHSWIGKLTTSTLTLPEFSDLITSVALSSRVPRPHGSLPFDRLPEAGRAVVEDKIRELQSALEHRSSTTDQTVDLIGCALVYVHGILERCLQTQYSEMVFFNLMKLLARYRHRTTFAHEPDSLETSELLLQWQPWLPKHGRTLPRVA